MTNIKCITKYIFNNGESTLMMLSRFEHCDKKVKFFSLIKDSIIQLPCNFKVDPPSLVRKINIERIRKAVFVVIKFFN